MTSSQLPSTTKPKVALGMSGGVDSSVCAHLLVEQGYDVTGVYLECWRAPGCRTEEDRQDALKVALSLDIPFKVLDFKTTYHDNVVANFFAEYQAGRTPNPDVLCNREIKFGLFYDWAMNEGFEYIATGHYAKIAPQNEHSDQLGLWTPHDLHKDQTYFLYQLRPEQLDHVLFPLANLTKTEVRAEATQRKLHVASKKDSVGICFIGDINVHNFLKERLGENPGEVVNVKGEVIGSHQGLWFYTIGQRHGFEIKTITSIIQSDGTVIDKHNIPPFYVIRKNPAKNQLVVGFGKDTLAQEFSAVEWHWTSPSSEFIQKAWLADPELKVRVRHTGALLSARVNQIDQQQLQISLQQPAQGIASGQSVVAYLPNQTNTAWLCLGGGIIMDPRGL